METRNNGSLMKRMFRIQTRANQQGSVNSAGGTSPLAGVIPPARDAAMTVEKSLSLAAVYRSVVILSTGVSQLELGVWRNGAEIETPSLVAQPDVTRSQGSFLKRTTISLATQGNAYWRINRDASKATASEPYGIASSLEVLDPLQVSIWYDERGNKKYNYNGYLRPVTLNAHDVAHLRLTELPGHTLGLGPIQAFMAGLQSAVNTRDYADGWFQRSEIPLGVLTTDQDLDDEEVTQAAIDWDKRRQESRTAILKRGLRYEAVLLNPAEAQWLENQQFAITDIARIFGIPDRYLLAGVNGSSMTYTNMTDVEIQFVRYTLMSYFSEIEDALTQLLPRGQRARFKVEQLLRADDKTRAETNAILLSSGQRTPNELRVADGLAPIAGGDEIKAAPVSTENNQGGLPTEQPIT